MAGKPFKLEPWQIFVIGNVLCWRHKDDGTRRFRTAFVSVPRKNGKSLLLSGVALWHLLADNEAGAELYSAATTTKQARKIHDGCKAMIQQSSALRKRLVVKRDEILYPAQNSIFRLLGKNTKSYDSLNIHCALIDELHAHPDRSLWDVITSATGSRHQPLIWAITTAGFDLTGICREKWDYGLEILNDVIEDDSYFCYIATMNEGDAWDDPTTWQKVNPNYGISVSERDLEIKANEAKIIPNAQRNFKTKHLNMWVDANEVWISTDVWDRTSDITSIEDLQGRECYGGLDLSIVSDFTSWCLVFPRPENPQHVDVIWRYWLPEAQLHNPQNKYRDQYLLWQAQGWLEVIPGETIDYELVKQRVLEDMAKYKIVSANVDRLFQGYQVAQELQEAGLPIVPLGMGYLSLAAPSAEFERKILNGQIHHGGNPISRWMLTQTMAAQDTIGNKKPAKRDGNSKIDGVVTLIMALERLIRHQGSSEDAPILNY